MTLSKKELEQLRRKNPDIRIPDEDLKIESFNRELRKSIVGTALTIKDVKKALGLKDSDIAEIFAYKNVMSYRNSGAKNRIDNAIVRLYELYLNKT